MQDLVNEQIRMYGMDIYYIPREFVREATIMREVTSSQFNSYFIIEAYLNNTEGYGGQGDIMSKFGIQVKDELTLVVSRERYENYIAPFLNSRMQYLLDSRKTENSLKTIHRPKEGDLIYFPLGRRLFEIKFVEHEQPFYQLGKGYTYELQCELFEYEDEVLDTTIDEIDTSIMRKGPITTVELMPVVSDNAEVEVNIGPGYVQEFRITNEGFDYEDPPTVIIEDSPLGFTPELVTLLSQPNAAVTTKAVQQVVVFSSGAGYNKAPLINLVGGDGCDAQIKAYLNEDHNSLGVVNFTVTEEGFGYPVDVDIVVYNEQDEVVAKGKGLTDGTKIVKTIVTDPGENLTNNVRAVVAPPNAGGEGVFLYNELVIGQTSKIEARCRIWDAPSFTLQVTDINPNKEGQIDFLPGEVLEGVTSGARYTVKKYIDLQTRQDQYSENDQIQLAADEIVDTSEYNPFRPEHVDQDFNDFNPFGE